MVQKKTKAGKPFGWSIDFQASPWIKKIEMVGVDNILTTYYKAPSKDMEQVNEQHLTDAMQQKAYEFADKNITLFERKMIQMRKCVGPYHDVVGREDPNHDKYWHSFEPKHNEWLLHIHERKDNKKPFVNADFECMMNNLRDYEKTFNKCLDGKQNCILTNEEKESIKLEHQKYLIEKKDWNAKKKQLKEENFSSVTSSADTTQATEPSVEKNNQIEQVNTSSLMNEKMHMGARMFAYAFTSSLLAKLQAYAKVYLYEYGNNATIQEQQIAKAMDIALPYVCHCIQFAVATGLTSSPLRALFGKVTQYILDQFIIAARLEKFQSASRAVGTMVTCIEDPTTLIDYVASGSAFAGGEYMASIVFRGLSLTKAKLETVSQHSMTHEVQSKNNSHATLRKRL